MIKRTLYFGNPAYIRTSQEQLVLEYPNEQERRQVPIEDIGVVILDHPQITISHAIILKLLENNVALITCDERHHPIGLLLNLDGNTLQSQKFKSQIEATEPLKKQLWQQTVKAKIGNQAALLDSKNIPAKTLYSFANQVKSGDSDNLEAQAASYYWKHLFLPMKDFKREREGLPPNNLLNYGYAILRAITARSLVGSGMLPTLGIFHRNQYNAYCLADDIMEPYRPIVDAMVWEIWASGVDIQELNKTIKARLLQLPTIDVMLPDKKSPLMIAMQSTTASLARCMDGMQRKIVYPTMLL